MKNELREILDLFKNSEVDVNLLNNVCEKLDVAIEENKQSIQFLQQLNDTLSRFNSKTSFIDELEKESFEIKLQALRSEIYSQILQIKKYE